MKKPYYYQRGENYEPEFIGFADDFNGALDLVDKNEIYEMSVVDEMDKDMYLSLRNELADEDVKELDKFFGLQTPLEALKKIKKERYMLIFEKRFPHDHCPNFDLWFEKECCKDLNLIETALKEKINIENRLDEIFENHNIKSFTELNERLCDYNELKFDDDIKQKKLKAFEIIQRKMPILYDILRSENYEFYMKHFGTYAEENTAYELTKEEFDLLKEVLLWKHF